MNTELELQQAKILLKMVLSEGTHIDSSTLKAIDAFIRSPIKSLLAELRVEYKSVKAGKL